MHQNAEAFCHDLRISSAAKMSGSLYSTYIFGENGQEIWKMEKLHQTK